MLQRGRKTVFVDNGTVPVKAPSGLNKAEKKLFDDMIASVDRRHFVESDTPLLVSYVQATHHGVSRRRVRRCKSGCLNVP